MTSRKPGTTITNHQRVDATQEITNRVGVTADGLIHHRVNLVICFYHRSSALMRYIRWPQSVRIAPQNATDRAGSPVSRDLRP